MIIFERSKYGLCGKKKGRRAEGRGWCGWHERRLLTDCKPLLLPHLGAGSLGRPKRRRRRNCHCNALYTRKTELKFRKITI